MIENADLPERASLRALEVFRRLAVAEGAVHDEDPEEVTFHEVGAVDSIVDVVGSCVALDLLDADSVSCGPLPMGTGVVDTAHGPLPVPGPATLKILKGSRVRWTDEPRETTTPTGAALMASFTGGEFTDAAPPMTLQSVGYGAGNARLRNTPNLLRAVVGELEGPAGDVELLEANVDDASGELLGTAVERLLAAGALDAWLEPIMMKRGRGAYKACALVVSGDRERFVRLLMRETGTLGVRHHPVGRTIAERRIVEVELPYGGAGSRSEAWMGRISSSLPSTPTPSGSPLRPVCRCPGYMRMRGSPSAAISSQPSAVRKKNETRRWMSCSDYSGKLESSIAEPSS